MIKIQFALILLMISITSFSQKASRKIDNDIKIDTIEASLYKQGIDTLITIREVRGMVKKDTTILDTTILYKNGFGINWELKKSGINYSKFVASRDGQYQTLVDNINYRIYRSGDYGVTWEEITTFYTTSYTSVSMSYDGQYQTTCSGTYLYRSDDYGITWTQITSPHIVGRNWISLDINATGQYQVAVYESLGNIGYYLYYSTDYGVTWTQNTNLSTIGFYDVKISGDGNYVVARLNSSSYVHVSSDHGQNFYSRITNWFNSSDLSYDGKYQTLVDNNGVIISSNYGVNWSSVFIKNDINPQNVIVSGDGKNQVLTPSGYGKLYYSNDYGASWNISESDSLEWKYLSTDSSGNNQYAVSANGIYRSVNKEFFHSKYPVVVKNWTNMNAPDSYLAPIGFVKKYTSNSITAAGLKFTQGYLNYAFGNGTDGYGYTLSGGNQATLGTYSSISSISETGFQDGSIICINFSAYNSIYDPNRFATPAGFAKIGIENANWYGSVPNGSQIILKLNISTHTWEDVTNSVPTFFFKNLFSSAGMDQFTPAGAPHTLMTTGTGTPPVWASLPDTIAKYGGSSQSINLIDATAGNQTFTLPTAVGKSGKIYIIKKIDSTSNTVTIETTNSETIDGNTSITFSNQYQCYSIISNDVGWYIISIF